MSRTAAHQPRRVKMARTHLHLLKRIIVILTIKVKVIVKR